MQTPDGPRIQRAAIYLRISQERSNTKTYATDALERQRADCEYQCRYHGWQVVDTYIDRAKSAFNVTTTRPEFNRMLEDYRAGKFDVVVVWKLDRLVRRVGTLAKTLDTIPDMVLCTGDLGLLDLSTIDSRYMANMLASNAEFESARKGERERRANLQHAVQGRPRRASRRCWGYTADREVIPEEAAVVRELYAARVEGYPVNDLLRALNGEETVNPLESLKTAIAGLKDPQRPWKRTRLRYLLVNPKYAGFVAYVSEPIGSGPRRQRAGAVLDAIVRDEHGDPVRGNWEPIIDEATWRKSVNMARKHMHGRRDNYRKYFGTGIYRCGVCGEPLYASDGSYRCLHKGHVSRLQKPIDDLVIATIRERFAQPDMSDLLPRVDDARLDQIAEEIADCDGQLARIRDDYREEKIDGAFYREIYDEQTSRRDSLVAERSALTRDPTGGMLTCDDPVAAFDAILDDPVKLNHIVDYLVTVTIHPFHRDRKRGKRTFNYEGIDIQWKEH